MDIKVQQLSKTFRTKIEQKRVLNNISFHIKQGEWVNVIGRSGSGKTTLLKCVAGLLAADSGSQISIGPLQVHAEREETLREFRRKHIGFIYQDYQLFPAYTAKQNVMLPEWPYKKKEELEERAEDLLRKLNLEERMNSTPDQLSGGEQQRVAIARALLDDPEILICDEPTGNLDRNSRDEVLQILKDCQQEGRTILLVTHDYEILKYGDRVFQMNDGELREIEKEEVILV